MTILLAQEANANSATSSATSTAVSFTGCAANCVLIATAGHGTGVNWAATPITDTVGLTWTKLADVTVSSRELTMWWAPFAVGGSITVTANFESGTTQYGIFLTEIDNVSATPQDGYIGQSQSDPGNGANVVTTGSGAASTNANEPALVYGIAWESGSVDLMSVGTSPIAFTEKTAVDASSTYGGSFLSEYATINTSGSAIAATWGMTAGGGSTNFASLMAIFDQGSVTPTTAVPSGGFTQFFTQDRMITF